MTYLSVNPYDGETLQLFDDLSDAQLDASIATAAGCFRAWQSMPIEHRASVLVRAAAILRARVDNFARLATLEMGKLVGQARREVLLSADVIEYYAANAQGFLEAQPIQVIFGRASIEASPSGVVFGVEPRDFPYFELARFTAPNLMAGNVVMVKHASCVPQCANAFEALWREAGAPEGTFTNLRITHRQVRRVIDDPRIKGIALSGGVAGDSDVSRTQGHSRKRTAIELARSETFVVLDDANLQQTRQWDAWGKLNPTGDCFLAAKRFIVSDKVADSLLRTLRSSLAIMEAGDPMDAATTLAPMSSETALQTVLSQIAAAVAAGATVVLGGKRMDRPGAFLQPTILESIRATNPAYHQQFSGPVVVFYRCRDDAEAAAIANAAPRGSATSIFTRSLARANRLAGMVHAGAVAINQPAWTASNGASSTPESSSLDHDLACARTREFVSQRVVRAASIYAPNRCVVAIAPEAIAAAATLTAALHAPAAQASELPNHASSTPVSH